MKREPDRRRAGDRQQDFERRQPHRAGERRNDRAHAGQESAHEQAGKPVPLVQLLDPLSRRRSRVLLEPVQKRLRAVSTTEGVSDARAEEVAEPAEEENGERRAVSPVARESSERDYGVRWKRRKEVLERREHRDRGVQRSEGQVTEPSRDCLEHSLAFPVQRGDGNAGEPFLAPDPAHSFVGLPFDAHARWNRYRARSPAARESCRDTEPASASPRSRVTST